MKIFQVLQPKSLIVAAFIAAIPVSVGALATLTGLAATPAVAVDVIRFDQKWLVTVDEARALIASGALVLDARAPGLKAGLPLPHAQPILWQDLADGHGQLLDDEAMLNQRLQTLGVDGGQPIVVLADPARGLGADAQVVWGLRSLGHKRAVMVDGGLPALLAAGLPTIQPPFGKGGFVVDRADDWAITGAEISAHKRDRDFVILATEAAQELLADDGRLKSRGRIEAILAAKGIDRDKVLATDGRNGAVAAWLTAVLIDLGYSARNLVGTAEYPLTASN